MPANIKSLDSYANANHANNKLNDISFNYGKILEVIQSLDPSKAHSYDGVSVRKSKLSCSSIIKPPLIIFCNCFKFRTFPDD